jgi:hypothetical protein
MGLNYRKLSLFLFYGLVQNLGQGQGQAQNLSQRHFAPLRNAFDLDLVLDL